MKEQGGKAQMELQLIVRQSISYATHSDADGLHVDRWDQRCNRVLEFDRGVFAKNLQHTPVRATASSVVHLFGLSDFAACCGRVHLSAGLGHMQ